MANNTIDQSTFGTVSEALPVEQKALIIRDRAQAMVESASLQQVQERMPEYVAVVQDLIAALDVNNPLTLAQAGSWALQEQAEAGLELLSAVQQGPGQQALLEIDAFEKRLRDRIKPLEARLQLRSAKTASKSSLTARVGAVASSLFKSKEALRTLQSAELQTEMKSLQEDGALLGKVVAQTVEDTVKMKRILGQNRNVPQIIEEQVGKAMDTHAVAAEKLYLSLVSINEFQKTLRTEKIPELEARASAPNSIDSDIDALQRAKEALGLLETRRTDLMSAFLNTCLQRGMVAEMGKINAASAIEMERLENIALPQMLGMLGTLALQQRTGELVAGSKAGNKIVADTTRSMAQGFGRVLQLSQEADLAKLSAATAVVQATTSTLDAVQKFREHEAKHIERQKVVQGQLVQAVGSLRVAAARVGNLPEDKRFSTVDKAATDALTLQATGLATERDFISTPATNPEPALPTTSGVVAEPPRPPAKTSAASLFDAARKSRNDRA